MEEEDDNPEIAKLDEDPEKEMAKQESTEKVPPPAAEEKPDSAKVRKIWRWRKCYFRSSNFRSNRLAEDR